MTVRELWAALLGSQLLCFGPKSCEAYGLPDKKFSPHDFFETFKQSYVWNKHIIVLQTGVVNELPGAAVLMTIELEPREE